MLVIGVYQNELWGFENFSFVWMYNLSIYFDCFLVLTNVSFSA